MAETLRRAGPRHSDETAAEFAARTGRFDDLGQRLTTCCAAYSTYMDASSDPAFDQVLCCKACYNEVPIGEGDGTEFAPGVDADTYFRVSFARDKLDPLLAFPHSLEVHQMVALREDVVASFTSDPELTWAEYEARIDGRWGSYADVLHSQQVRALRLLAKSEALSKEAK